MWMCNKNEKIEEILDSLSTLLDFSIIFVLSYVLFLSYEVQKKKSYLHVEYTMIKIQINKIESLPCFIILRSQLQHSFLQVQLIQYNYIKYKI